MANYHFSATGVGEWAEAAKTRSVRVARRALKNLAGAVIDDAPIDTGFMVSSAQVHVGAPWGYPITALERPPGFKDPGAKESKMDQVDMALKKMPLGESFGLTFVANYTKYVHEGIGQPAQPFLERNLAAWPSFVREAVDHYKK